MAHLSPAVLVDLLEGTVLESAVPHVASCAACRAQLAELRATWQAATEADVPEPSPLFWDHLSSRVRERVAAEPVPRAPWWQFDWSWRIVGLASTAAAAVALVVVLQGPRVAPVAPDSMPLTPGTADLTTAAAAVEPLAAPADDASLGFVADLASNLDWDADLDFGLSAHGDADRALADMNDGERAELQRLLTEALRGGA